MYLMIIASEETKILTLLNVNFQISLFCRKNAESNYPMVLEQS